MPSQYVLGEQIRQELLDELLRQGLPEELLEPIIDYWRSNSRMNEVRLALDIEREEGEREWHGLLREALDHLRQ